MSQQVCQPIQFPVNLKRTPPPTQHCKGPSLLENLFRNLYEVFPKCFEGAHLKLRKKLKDTIWGGYNQTLSSVHPSHGQLAAELHEKDIDARFSISPTGHSAFTTKIQLNSTESLTIDTQIKPSRIFIGETSLIHSKHNTTAALTVAAKTLPLNIRDLGSDASTKWNVIDNMVTSVSFQVVRRLQNCWIVGAHWYAGDNLKIGVCRRYHHGDTGILLDKVKGEGFWWKKLTTSVDIGVHVECPYERVEDLLLELGARWRYNGNQMRCFITTEGLVGFDYRKRVFQTEDSHIGIKLSGLLNGHNDKFRLGFGLDVYI